MCWYQSCQETFTSYSQSLPKRLINVGVWVFILTLSKFSRKYSCAPRLSQVSPSILYSILVAFITVVNICVMAQLMSVSSVWRWTQRGWSPCSTSSPSWPWYSTEWVTWGSHQVNIWGNEWIKSMKSCITKNTEFHWRLKLCLLFLVFTPQHRMEESFYKYQLNWSAEWFWCGQLIICVFSVLLWAGCTLQAGSHTWRDCNKQTLGPCFLHHLLVCGSGAEKCGTWGRHLWHREWFGAICLHKQDWI